MSRAAPRDRGFTVAELLVVIAIAVLLAAIAVPSFSSMINSQEESLAETLLRQGVRSGREAALRSAAGDDAALAFLFEPGGRLTLATYVYAGRLIDDGPGGAPIDRDVFVPDGSQQVIQLPKNWMVRGFAPAGWIDPSGQWYESGTSARTENGEPNWVFPETGLYNYRTGNPNQKGPNRQTFLIRFEGSTGLIRAGATRDVLLVSPGRPDNTNRLLSTAPQYVADLQKAEDIGRYVKSLFAASPSATRNADRLALLGDESTDTVLARAVESVVLYDESRLAAALGVRLDPFTGSLYRRDPSPPAGQPAYPQRPEYIQSTPTFIRNINRWLQGDTDFDGRIEPAVSANTDAPESRIYTVERYTGNLRRVEVQP